MLKIYVGHVASWVLFGIFNAIRVGLKTKQKTIIQLFPLTIISMIFGLVTFLIHYAFFL